MFVVDMNKIQIEKIKATGMVSQVRVLISLLNGNGFQLCVFFFFLFLILKNPWNIRNLQNLSVNLLKITFLFDKFKSEDRLSCNKIVKNLPINYISRCAWFQIHIVVAIGVCVDIKSNVCLICRLDFVTNETSWTPLT